MFQIAVVGLAGPFGDDIGERTVGKRRFDDEKVGNARLVREVEGNLAERIGRGGHDFLRGASGVVVEHDFGILTRGGFGHFFLGVRQIANAKRGIELHELHLVESFGWNGESLAETMIEALGEIAGELDVLELVFAEGDIGGVVEENVGGHQNRIVENADVTGVATFGLFFVLNHARSLAHGGDTIEEPAEFGVGGNARLAVDVDVVVQNEAGGEVIFQGAEGVGGEIAVNLGDNRVEVGNEDVDVAFAGILVGETNHREQGAEVVAEG